MKHGSSLSTLSSSLILVFSSSSSLRVFRSDRVWGLHMIIRVNTATYITGKNSKVPYKIIHKSISTSPNSRTKGKSSNLSKGIKQRELNVMRKVSVLVVMSGGIWSFKAYYNLPIATKGKAMFSSLSASVPSDIDFKHNTA